MGELAALAASAVWASASIIFSRLGKVTTPIAMNFLKGWIAFLFMIVTAMVMLGIRIPEMSAQTFWLLAASGLVGITIGDTSYFNALTRIGARRALLMSALVPPTTTVLGFLFLEEQITLPMIAGMGLTMAGVVWVIRERSENEESAVLRSGILFALGAVVCQSVGNVLTKAGSAEISALEISLVRILIGSLGLTVVLLFVKQLGDVKAVLKDPEKRKSIIIATILGTYLGIWFLNTGLKYTENTGVAATLSSTSPIFILPLAAWFDGEKLTVRAVVGALIAVAGVAILFST